MDEWHLFLGHVLRWKGVEFAGRPVRSSQPCMEKIYRINLLSIHGLCRRHIRETFSTCILFWCWKLIVLEKKNQLTFDYTPCVVVCKEDLVGLWQSSPTGRRISNAKIIRGRPFASRGGCENNREARIVRLRREPPPAVRRILDIPMWCFLAHSFSFCWRTTKFVWMITRK
jgi:hypothetical protein